MKFSDLYVALGFQGQQFQRGIKGAQKQTNLFARSIKSIGPTIAAAFSVYAIGNFIKTSAQAYDKQMKAEAKVAQAVKQTGQAAGLTADQLKSMASQLQRISIYGDEQILNDVTAQLLSFPQITGAAFVKAQKAALDLSTLIDGDLKSGTIALGKALADPITGLTALRRMGVLFSDEQQSQIKNLVAQNRLQEAQLMILEEINRQYGGQAEAATAGLGALQQLKNSWGDFQEQLFAATTANKAGGMFGWVKESVDYMTWGLDKIRERGNKFVDWWNWFWQVAEFSSEEFEKYLKDLEHQPVIDEMMAQAMIDAEKWENKANGTTEKHITTLGELKQRLQDLKDQRDEVSLSEVEGINKSIEALEEQIRKYEKLGTTAKQAAANIADFEKQIGMGPSSTIADFRMGQAALQGAPVEDPLYEMEYYIDGLHIMQEQEAGILEQRTAAWNDFQDGLRESFEQTAQNAQMLQQSLTAIGMSFGNAIGEMIEGEKSFGDIVASLIANIIKIVAGYLSQYVAASIAGGAEAGGPAAVLTGASAGVAAMGLFAAIVPALMAQGGVVPIGYPNDSYPAMLTSGEMVVPPHKLDAVMGTNRVEVVGMVRGEDIYYVMKKQERKQASYK